ncbi:SPOR domain-containing protein [Methylobacter sp. Wu8]|uniref:Sporulation related protein n=1 Tax=Methylobacter tundripaludum TaxID=173365 RepID=A0A2S6H6M3_9GAMM|nr:SPOR domain-containing protein [Methylobacter tundripaludum]MCK9635065.1 SPOR domain-containing protein [Methylobacter tundripaludum]PPK73135.1 sporulation related protein [Methylobacter tundripaludum]
MTDSMDKKAKEKRDNLTVDLDAMLDEAESSLLPSNEIQDDDDLDAIDRLLMDAGFDADDASGQTETKKQVYDAKDAELDELLSFDSFGGDFNEPEKNQSAVIEVGRTVEDLPFVSSNESQDDEDAIDRLLMDTGFHEDNAPEQANAEDAGAADEQDGFSGFSDFNEPEMGGQDSASATEEEELDDFMALVGDDFDPSDLIQDDDVTEAASTAGGLTTPEKIVEESGLDKDIDALDEVDEFSDFSDFNEPEAVEQDLSQTAEAEQAVADLPLPEEIADGSGLDKDVGALDEVNEFSDFSDFNEPEFVEQDLSDAAEDEKAGAESEQASAEALSDVEQFASAAVDSTETTEVVDESDVEEEAGTGLADEVDDFSFLSDHFDESDLIQDDEVTAAPAAEAVDVEDREEDIADENDDFSFLSDHFDESDLIQDDELTAAPAAEAVDAEDREEDIADEIDDFSGFSDEFDSSDLIRGDSESADLPAADEELETVAEESFNELQDDNGIDNLLADAGFDAEGELDQNLGKNEAFGDDADLSEINDLFQLDEVSDDSSWQAEGVQLGEAEEPSSAKEDDFLLPDFDITADMEISDAGVNKDDELADVFGDSGFLGPDEAVQGFDTETAGLKPGDNEAVAGPGSEQTAAPEKEDVANVKLSPFGFEQEDIKRQLEEAESKVKKAKLFSYVALGFGVVALSTAAGLGMMIYGAKTEVSKLNEVVSTLEASLAKSAANNPNEEMNAMRNSVVQLNQQVDGFITELKGNPQFPVDLLNHKLPDIVAKQDMVSKAMDVLQVKIGGPDVKPKPVSEPAVAVPPKVEVVHKPEPVKPEPVKEVKPQPVTPAKTGVEHAPAKEKNAHETEPAPAKVEAAHETAAAKEKTQPETVKAKPIAAEKIVVKQEPVKEKRQEAPGKWGVNLVAFKQEWFAKSKAAEFARQGVFAEVIPVREKNTTMYRLRVGGFKSKQEAQANTDKIKRALNLDSVWVSDN